MLNPSCDLVPLSEAELAALLERAGGFERRPRIAVAVSGGPDSMALLLLAERWARRRGGTAVGLTVDHRLRAESAEEAATIAGWLAARGISHQTLVWSGPKPVSGIQEAAREARYALLAEWCRKQRVLHLLTAHHREDQVETHLIRQRAGSGTDGLAGMAAVRELQGCRLVRPLLEVPRARLRAVLEAEKQPFLHDPSNLNPVFERARLRQTAVAGDAIHTALGASAEQRIQREQRLYPLLARTVAVHPAGFAALDPAALRHADAEAVERLLGKIAACIGGLRYPARRARLVRLRAALIAEPERARTLGGCCWLLWRGRILVIRELAAAATPLPLEPGARLIWDRRFRVELALDAPGGLALGFLAQEGAAAVTSAHDDLPPLLYPVLPAFRDARGIAAVPHLGYHRADFVVQPSLRFQPANPLAPPGFTVV